MVNTHAAANEHGNDRAKQRRVDIIAYILRLAH